MSESKRFTTHDTTLSGWFNGDAAGFTGTREMFHRVNRLLRKCGFAVGFDPQIERRYPSLNKDHRYGRKGDLEVAIDGGGCRVEIVFFQNVVRENPNGGKYDFDKLRKMPYLVRKRFEGTAAKLRELFAAAGYEIVPPKRSLYVDPLGWFNDSWDFECDKARGTHRFSRGPDGWPDDRELNCWRQTDHDGVPIRNLERRYTLVNGRALPCICYGGINGMWHGVYGKHEGCSTNRGAWAYRSNYPGRGRHFDDEQRTKAIKRDLQRAIKAKRFAVAERIARHCERAGIAIEIQRACVA